MQPFARTDYLTGAALTAGQVTSMVRDSPAITTWSVGCELLDVGLNVLADISDELAGGTVGRANYNTLHGSGTLYVSTDLDWGTAILRPYLVMGDGTVTIRVNLGAYLTSSPESSPEESPITHEVECFDILHWLNTSVGEAYTVDAGVGYLAAAEQILIAQGITSYWIDPTRADAVLDQPRPWAYDDNRTWLNIINDLLSGVGYQGVWSDWDGRLRLEPYLAPTDRAPEYVYTDDPDETIIDPKRKVIRDWFDAPNRWTFYRNQNPEDPAPVPGNGLFVYDNVNNGPTSQTARGRVISAKPQQLDAVDQAALESKAMQVIDADMRLKTTYELTTFPLPLCWHFDRFTLADSGLGPIVDVMGVKWTLPLNGDNMAHEWSLL